MRQKVYLSVVAEATNKLRGVLGNPITSLGDVVNNNATSLKNVESKELFSLKNIESNEPFSLFKNAVVNTTKAFKSLMFNTSTKLFNQVAKASAVGMFMLGSATLFAQLPGAGTEFDPHRIGNITDWDEFNNYYVLNNGTAGVYFKLMNNIGDAGNPSTWVTTMVGFTINNQK